MRVVVFDPEPSHGMWLAEPFQERGHAVLVCSSPLDQARVAAFEPQLILLSLYRDAACYGRSIERPMEEVAGLDFLLAMHQDAFFEVPRVVIGHGVEPQEVPAYMSFTIFLVCRIEPQVGLPIIGHLLLAKLDDVEAPQSPESPPAPADGDVEVVIRSLA